MQVKKTAAPSCANKVLPPPASRLLTLLFPLWTGGHKRQRGEVLLHPDLHHDVQLSRRQVIPQQRLLLLPTSHGTTGCTSLIATPSPSQVILLPLPPFPVHHTEFPPQTSEIISTRSSQIRPRRARSGGLATSLLLRRLLLSMTSPMSCRKRMCDTEAGNICEVHRQLRRDGGG